MALTRTVLDPTCPSCHRLMLWHSVQLVDAQPINVFHCGRCDRFAASTPAVPSMAEGFGN